MKSLDRRDVIVVGGGAAGLNAALILGRARRTVLLCDDGHPRNAVAERMHGFLSRDGMPPSRLLAIARKELSSYPSVEFVKARVEKARTVRDGFSVTLDSGKKFKGKRLLLTNGVRDKLPDIENLNYFWGRSVFVCPFCDGWEFRDRRIVVYGKTNDAIELAKELHGWTKKITVCTETKTGRPNAKNARWLAAAGCELVRGPIKRLIGKPAKKLVALELQHREQVPCDALFLSAPLRQSSTIAEALGCKVDSAGATVVDDKNRTNVADCYAAGDAVLSVHQVILAAASGVRAAIAISTDLLCAEADEMSKRG